MACPAGRQAAGIGETSASAAAPGTAPAPQRRRQTEQLDEAVARAACDIGQTQQIWMERARQKQKTALCFFLFAATCTAKGCWKKYIMQQFGDNAIIQTSYLTHIKTTEVR